MLDTLLAADTHVVRPRHGHVLIFLVLNYLLATAGFTVTLFGIAFSLGSLALCCFGVVVFQGLLYVAPLLARLDVALHNFVEPEENQLYGHIPYYGEGGSYLTRPSLAVLLYFSTAKFAIGVLGVMVVVIPLSMPMHALTSPIFRAEYFTEGYVNLIVFIVVATTLLVSGFAVMPHVAKLSCVTTRLLCREVFSSIYRHNDMLSRLEMPLEATTYGTK